MNKSPTEELPRIATGNDTEDGLTKDIERPENETEQRIAKEFIPLIEDLAGNRGSKRPTVQFEKLETETFEYLKENPEATSRIVGIMLARGLGKYVDTWIRPHFKLDEPTLIQLVKSGYGSYVAIHQWKIPEIKNHQAFIDACLGVGLYTETVQSICDADIKSLNASVAKQLLEYVTIATSSDTRFYVRNALARNFRKFTELDLELAEQIVSGSLDSIKELIKYPEDISGLTKENVEEQIAKWLVTRGDPEFFFTVIEETNLSVPRKYFYEIAQIWEKLPPTEKSYRLFREINRHYTPPLSEILNKFLSISTNFASFKLYEMYRRGQVNETDLKVAFESIKDFVQKEEDSQLQEILKDPLRFEVFKSYLRVDESQWGYNSDEETKKVIERYLKNKNGYAPLPEGYETNVMVVAKSERKKDEIFTYTPEFKERWQIIQKALTAASMYTVFEGKVSVSDLKSEFKRILSQIITDRRRDVEKQAENPRAREYAEKLLADAESVSLSDLEHTFTILFDGKKTKDLNLIFLTFGFLVALKRHNLESVKLSSDSFSNPTAEDISATLDFVTHIAHQETWEKSGRFSEKKSRDKLNELFHVKALEDQLVKIQQRRKASKETVSITVRPSRAILTEFSGHMGNACWASKYEILERENISSLSFFLNGQVVGSCLLIDTVDAQKTPITIIRGLNPLEGTINKLDLESFVKTLVAYLEEVALKRGRRLAIVIDDHVGGSSTNRPMLHGYLCGLRNALKRVSGIHEKDTTFNGYNISRDTYLILSDVFENK